MRIGSDDELAAHNLEIRQLLEDRIGTDARDAWIDNTAHLPQELTLGEVRDYLWADTDEQQADVLRVAFARLGVAFADDEVLSHRAFA